jgi:carotenoid cleavage dioxygenase-like enzyme
MDVEVVGKFLSTLPEDDDHPYRTGPWRPQTTEFDAARVTDGPVCKLTLPARISSGTHSTWAPGSAWRGWRTADSAPHAIGL